MFIKEKVEIEKDKILEKEEILEEETILEKETILGVGTIPMRETEEIIITVENNLKNLKIAKENIEVGGDNHRSR